MKGGFISRSAGNIKLCKKLPSHSSVEDLVRGAERRGGRGKRNESGSIVEREPLGSFGRIFLKRQKSSELRTRKLAP